LTSRSNEIDFITKKHKLQTAMENKPSSIRFESESARRNYDFGMRIVNAKIEAGRKARPTADDIHKRSLATGREIIAKKLSSATPAKTLAAAPASPPAKPQIDVHQFRAAVFEAAKAAALEASAIRSKPTSKAPASAPPRTSARANYHASGRVKHLCSGGGLFGR
jgi:hypothetical protein